jgi:hypothetical protein
VCGVGGRNSFSPILDDEVRGATEIKPHIHYYLKSKGDQKICFNPSKGKFIIKPFSYIPFMYK